MTVPYLRAGQLCDVLCECQSQRRRKIYVCLPVCLSVAGDLREYESSSVSFTLKMETIMSAKTLQSLHSCTRLNPKPCSQATNTSQYFESLRQPSEGPQCKQDTCLFMVGVIFKRKARSESLVQLYR